MKIAKFFALLCAATVGFVACTPAEDQKAPNVTGSITLTADKTVVTLEDEVHFTAEMKNAETGAVEDVTAFVSLYDSNLDEVSNPFKPETSGIYNITASYGAESSNIVTITVMGSLPELPEDPDAACLAFNHRGLFIDNTGMGCGYCPSVVDVFEALKNTETHKYYNEVQVHGGGYAQRGDPAYSDAANQVDQFYGPSGYPDVRLNFYGGQIGTRTAAGFKNALMSYIKEDGADAGISLAVSGDKSNIYCAAQVKAKVAQEYKVVAWLLESGIYSPGQAGATKDYHKVYNYALRDIHGEYSKNNISGESIGVLEEGKTHNCAFMLPIKNNKWNWENMGVLVIVSAKDAQGRWEVANSAYCKVNDSKTYEYVE